MSSFLLRREETSSRVIVSRIIGRVQLGSKWFAFRFLPLLPFWRWVCRGINRRLPKFTLLLPLNTFRHSHPCLYCVKTGMNNYRDSQFLCSSFFAKKLLSGFWSFELLNKDREEKKRFPIFPNFPPPPSFSSRSFWNYSKLDSPEAFRRTSDETRRYPAREELGTRDPRALNVFRNALTMLLVAHTNGGQVSQSISPSICDWLSRKVETLPNNFHLLEFWNSLN